MRLKHFLKEQYQILDTLLKSGNVEIRVVPRNGFSYMEKRGRFIIRMAAEVFYRLG